MPRTLPARHARAPRWLTTRFAPLGRVMIWYALIAPGLLFTISCGAAPPATPVSEPTQTPTPRQAIERSNARMLLLDTAGFTLEHEGAGSSQLFPGVQLSLVEGQVNMPDRFSLRVEAISSLPRTFLEIDLVVEDRAYHTDFVSRDRWIPMAMDSLPFDFADLGRTLGGIIRALEDPVFAGTGVVDGVLSWRVKGTVQSESLGTLTPAADEGHTVGLELWIGQDQALLRKVRIEGQVLSSDRTDVVRVLSLYRFDGPVEIALPPGVEPLSEGADAR